MAHRPRVRSLHKNSCIPEIRMEAAEVSYTETEYGVPVST